MKILSNKSRVILITMVLILVVLLINQLKYRNDELYAVNLKNKIDKDLVSILVSDGSNNYTNYEGNTFPSNIEYTFNSEMSKCQDNNGNVIEGILSYNEESGKVSIRTSKTTYCYLYFDKKIGVEITGNLIQGLIESNTLWQSGLEGDGYRYTGSGDATASTSPNNFICFGTTSLEECKANEEKYMYRIIGVFRDEEEGGDHLKLIKYKSIGSYDWHSEDVDVFWDESDLYKGLNGISGGSYNNLFIGNTTYDYLQDNTWLNKIVDWIWTVTNTLTLSDSVPGGPDYFSITTEQMYLHEMDIINKIGIPGTELGECYSYYMESYNAEGTCDFEIGDWSYPSAKIGLMYASDYQMSLGSGSLTMTSYNDSDTLKTGWLHPSNNGTSEDIYGLLISRMGYNYYDGNGFYTWVVDGSGAVNADSVHYEYGPDDPRPDRTTSPGVFPVFYLDSTVEASGGTGSYSSPYLISN